VSAVLIAPFAFLLSWLAGLLSLGLLIGGPALLWAWYAGAVVGTGYLVAGLALVLWALAGRWVALLLLGRGGLRHPQDAPELPALSAVERLRRPDGTELHVERSGPAAAPPIVLAHGWGAGTEEWAYLRGALAGRFRLLAFDLRGHGRSSPSPAGDYSVDTLAGDLAAVADLAGDRPAVLLGHSAGGMATLALCRRFPERLGPRVAGLVLVNTTDLDPVRSTTAAGLFSALRGPLLTPLLWLTVWLWPLLWLSSWLSYANGTAHALARLTGFAGRPQRGQLDAATRLNTRTSPAVLARGVLGMFRYDERATLGGIGVPVLVVTGDRDRVLVPQVSARLCDALPAAELAVLRPAGHMGPWEHHGPFADDVAAFAARCLSAPPPAAGRAAGSGRPGRSGAHAPLTLTSAEGS
jgi:pimeloyl-ACP methyl ester carboxylesterase